MFRIWQQDVVTTLNTCNNTNTFPSVCPAQWEAALSLPPDCLSHTLSSDCRFVWGPACLCLMGSKSTPPALVSKIKQEAHDDEIKTLQSVKRVECQKDFAAQRSPVSGRDQSICTDDPAVAVERSNNSTIPTSNGLKCPVNSMTHPYYDLANLHKLFDLVTTEVFLSERTEKRITYARKVLSCGVGSHASKLATHVMLSYHKICGGRIKRNNSACNMLAAALSDGVVGAWHRSIRATMKKVTIKVDLKKMVMTCIGTYIASRYHVLSGLQPVKVALSHKADFRDFLVNFQLLVAFANLFVLEFYEAALCTAGGKMVSRAAGAVLDEEQLVNIEGRHKSAEEDMNCVIDIGIVE
ncbi:hypothetical protein J6590_030362 [Homalodisca vitripennis]|nr:hypothetical protein J6590_030362 [Homalodisca vitripennis]